MKESKLIFEKMKKGIEESINKAYPEDIELKSALKIIEMGRYKNLYKNDSALKKHFDSALIQEKYKLFGIRGQNDLNLEEQKRIISKYLKIYEVLILNCKNKSEFDEIIEALL